MNLDAQFSYLVVLQRKYSRDYAGGHTGEKNNLEYFENNRRDVVFLRHVNNHVKQPETVKKRSGKSVQKTHFRPRVTGRHFENREAHYAVK